MRLRVSPPASPLAIAHRGASAHAPEHTLAAYDFALGAGADCIEQDLQMTRDGVIIVLHDDTLDRTTRGAGCRGRVIDRSLAEIRDCDAGSWFNERMPGRARATFAEERIPPLDVVFERYAGRANFYIETKNPEEAPGMEEALLRLLDAHGLRPPGPDPPSLLAPEALPRVIVQSFSERSLRLIRALAPELPLVQLVRSRTGSGTIRRRLGTIAGYAQAIGPARGSVDAALVDEAHRSGLAVHPYTVNEEVEMRRLIGLGVDGLFTDDPGVLVRVRERR
ncbi:MAG: glycerophosphodiester phosphodiesterase [Longimicrobiales bacterium]